MKYVVYDLITGTVKKWGISPKKDVQTQAKEGRGVIIVDSLERNMDLNYTVDTVTKKLLRRIKNEHN